MVQKFDPNRPLEALWRHLGLPLGALGALLGALGGSWDALWSSWGSLWALWGAFGSSLERCLEHFSLILELFFYTRPDLQSVLIIALVFVFSNLFNRVFRVFLEFRWKCGCFRNTVNYN